jgi:hypothetical protein
MLPNMQNLLRKSLSGLNSLAIQVRQAPPNLGAELAEPFALSIRDSA